MQNCVYAVCRNQDLHVFAENRTTSELRFLVEGNGIQVQEHTTFIFQASDSMVEEKHVSMLNDGVCML